MKEQEIKNILLQNEKNIGEFTDINQRLKEEINYHKQNGVKIHENLENLNYQFVNTLNKQKEQADFEIISRDKIILDLNTKLGENHVESDIISRDKIISELNVKIEEQQKQIENQRKIVPLSRKKIRNSKNQK